VRTSLAAHQVNAGGHGRILVNRNGKNVTAGVRIATNAIRRELGAGWNMMALMDCCNIASALLQAPALAGCSREAPNDFRCTLSDPQHVRSLVRYSFVNIKRRASFVDSRVHHRYSLHLRSGLRLLRLMTGRRTHVFSPVEATAPPVA
jgi:hypothetical protein